MKLTPKKWEEFQHYKDRAPLWIKLHRGLLDNMEYHLLSDFAAKRLPLIWLIASECDGVLPDVGRIAFRLRISDDKCQEVLDELVERDFLVEYTGAEPAEQGATLAQRIAKANGFGTRHISDAVKREVWQRDGGKCCACGSVERIEYDHKNPVSNGGTSEAENIQLLCRPCNRSKRTKLATPAQPLRSLEKRREEIEKEKNVAFEKFWKDYPRTPVMSKKEAAKAWKVLSDVDQLAALAAVAPFKEWLAKQRDHPVVHACRFLSQRRFDGFKPTLSVASTMVFLKPDTEAWDAWQAVKPTPTNKDGGWYFESEYPPGYEPKAA